MLWHYRITKYDPSCRNEIGAFLGDEWTSISDVGRIFSGVKLLESEYLTVETAYLLAIEALLRQAKIEALVLRAFENHSDDDLPEHFRSGASLTIDQCINFAQLALREKIWGKLSLPGRAYVHFGYDYNMYVGVSSRCAAAVSQIQTRKLFVEHLQSPYLRG